MIGLILVFDIVCIIAAPDSSHTGFVKRVIDSVKLFEMFVSSESMEINLVDNAVNIQTAQRSSASTEFLP